ncbi:unnamed protein product, partial [marine sediment metagenome]
IKEYKTYFKLTEEGHDYVFENILPSIGEVREFSDIRSQVIGFKYRGKRSYDFNKERERLLEH